MSPEIFFLLLIQVSILNLNPCAGKDLPKFQTILIFGDSTVDTGNNNYIPTIISKGNHPPYGQDFPGREATGRFSNGKLVPDLVASMLGIKETVPPFLDPNLTNEDLITGVSFASAGSGYDEVTSLEDGSIPVSQQPGMFQNYVDRLKGIVGEEMATNITNGALVIINAGTNDFVFNFYDLATRTPYFTIDGYQDFVLNKFQNFVKELYGIGCRTMVVGGLPPIGCLPIQMTIKLGAIRLCLDYQNSDAQIYNQKLADLLPNLESSLPGSRIIYSDSYTPMTDMMNNPQKYGFTETQRGCCGTGLIEAGPFCSSFSTVCPSPSQFMFWDGIHPTESTYRYLTNYLAQAILGQI
ncbi:GDSL esterase/lipase At2g30220-like [Actinidia eriantha]|uniref:GDSL esterase/lipase At2g30220-like n=1 Tax=Actinidia eriantha TaxID=165200 RepID=UPI0025826F9A|nr:GDSL esterase/lipase At2g30220-like [Actinidia eriantha]